MFVSKPTHRSRRAPLHNTCPWLHAFMHMFFFSAFHFLLLTCHFCCFYSLLVVLHLCCTVKREQCIYFFYMYEKLSNHFWTRKGKWVIKMKISTLFRFNCLLTACSKYISLSEKAPHYTDLDSQSEQSFTHIWMHRGYLEITCNAWLLKITQPQYTQSGG